MKIPKKDPPLYTLKQRHEIYVKALQNFDMMEKHAVGFCFLFSQITGLDFYHDWVTEKYLPELYDMKYQPFRQNLNLDFNGKPKEPLFEPMHWFPKDEEGYALRRQILNYLIDQTSDKPIFTNKYLLKP